jgi:hypothetical protein
MLMSPAVPVRPAGRGTEVSGCKQDGIRGRAAARRPKHRWGRDTQGVHGDEAYRQ